MQVRMLAVVCCALVSVTTVRAEPAAAVYEWRLPKGFPTPAVPADNLMSTAKVELGHRLFFDPRLSADGTISCASCHDPQRAFTDQRAQSAGVGGVALRRSSMPLLNVAYMPSYTWADHSIATLEAQMRVPLFNQHPVEIGLSGREAAVVNSLQHDESYLRAFNVAFASEPQPVSIDNVIKAIAAFERTLIAGNSAFDRYVFDDDRAALSESAKRGMALFYSSRIGCGQCHSGINFSGTIQRAGSGRPAAMFANTGLYNVDGSGSYPVADTGLAEITHRSEDNGKFRVPTLRNVQLTAPYMHDGCLVTLDDVITHYARGGRQSPSGASVKNSRKDPRIHGFNIDAQERADLIAFLNSLTDATLIAK